MSDNFSEIQHYMHQQSREAGWWEDMTEENRVYFNATKLGLIMSEAAEAFEAYRRGKKDEHLPHRDALEVELTDVVIRTLDLAEAMGYDILSCMKEKDAYNKTRQDFKVARTGAEGSKKF